MKCSVSRSVSTGSRVSVLPVIFLFCGAYNISFYLNKPDCVVLILVQLLWIYISSITERFYLKFTDKAESLMEMRGKQMYTVCHAVHAHALHTCTPKTQTRTPHWSSFSVINKLVTHFILKWTHTLDCPQFPHQSDIKQPCECSLPKLLIFLNGCHSSTGFSHLPLSTNSSWSHSLISCVIWSPSAWLIRTFPEFQLFFSVGTSARYNAPSTTFFT